MPDLPALASVSEMAAHCLITLARDPESERADLEALIAILQAHQQGKAARSVMDMARSARGADQ